MFVQHLMSSVRFYCKSQLSHSTCFPIVSMTVRVSWVHVNWTCCGFKNSLANIIGTLRSSLCRIIQQHCNKSSLHEDYNAHLLLHLLWERCCICFYGHFGSCNMLSLGCFCGLQFIFRNKASIVNDHLKVTFELTGWGFKLHLRHRKTRQNVQWAV